MEMFTIDLTWQSILFALAIKFIYDGVEYLN